MRGNLTDVELQCPTRKRSTRRLAVLGGACALLLVAVFAVAPKQQAQDDHLFADTWLPGPVPNALNVLSNVAFLAVAFWGLAVVLSQRAGTAYAAALLLEQLDQRVKAVTGITGGHPLKQIAAAAGTACLVVMLARRKAPGPAAGPS